MQPQDLALTIFGSYLREPESLAWSGGMVELLRLFGFSTAASRAALSRLATRGLIARTKRGRKIYYRLTPRASALLVEGDRRIFTFGRSNDRDVESHWTILWHWLPEGSHIERARLGRRLRFLGFGLVQDGTWVAPHDRGKEVTELLHALGVADHAYLVVGEPTKALDMRTVIRQAWDLEAMTERYEAFLAEFGPYRAERLRGQLDRRDAFFVRTRAVHLFRGFPFLDPEFPDRFMPQPGLRPQVISTFEELYESLRDNATRYFDAIARGDPGMANSSGEHIDSAEQAGGSVP